MCQDTDALQGSFTRRLIKLSGTIQVMTNQLSLSLQGLTVAEAIVLVFQAAIAGAE